MGESLGSNGLIFDIKRFALHDGPGIRTTVFSQGCPLRCAWCQNPESQYSQPQLFYSAGKCRACRTCMKACPQGAVTWSPEGRLYDGRRCVYCGVCVKSCWAGALTLAGTRVTAAQVWHTVQRDTPFYAKSRGGVTLSGGEPLAQPDFARDILRLCRQSSIHTALDTTAYAPWPTLSELLAYTDLVLLDIKVLDPARHRRLTGVDNGLILANTAKLAQSGAKLVVRVPVIPGQNDDAENLQSIATFLAGLQRVDQVELLPYNRLARSKYSRLGLDYTLADTEAPGPEQMQSARHLLSRAGWPVVVTWGLGMPGPSQDR